MDGSSRQAGGHEDRFFHSGEVYLMWGEALQNLSAAKSYEAIKEIVFDAYPGEPKARIQNWTGQIWASPVHY